MKDKTKAAALHLLLSLIILTGLLSYALYVWYPAPLLDSSGLENILLILLTVDLVLGPLLTFIIFKPQKATLKSDLSFIALIQVIALGYGMFTIYQGHPVYITYALGQFTPVLAVNAEPENAKYEQLKVSTFGPPKLVYTKLPDSPGSGKLLFKDLLSGNATLESKAKFYEPYEKYQHEVVSQGLDPEKLFTDKAANQKLQLFLSKTPKPDDSVKDYAFLPLVGKTKDVIWVLDRETGKPVGSLDINPWPKKQMTSLE